MKAKAVAVARCLKGLPMKMMIGATVFSIMVDEFYPFSSFGMYAKPHVESVYVYVTGADDEPLKLRRLCGLSVARLKKVYKSHIRVVGAELGMRSRSPEVKRIAAERALNQLYEMHRELQLRNGLGDALELGDLKLWSVDLKLRKGSILRKTTLIAEVSPP